MRIGYAPGACLRGYLQRLGYDRRVLFESGLVNERGRDAFFRCLTFPLEQAGNLYGRSIIASGICRHRFLPGSKGGLYGWQQGTLDRLTNVQRGAATQSHTPYSYSPLCAMRIPEAPI